MSRRKKVNWGSVTWKSMFTLARQIDDFGGWPVSENKVRLGVVFGSPSLIALQRGERPQLLARGLAEVLQRIDQCPALRQFMQLADRLVRCEVGLDRCLHDLLGTRDSSRQRHDAHPADHTVEGYELLNLWLVAHESTAMCFRRRNDKILVEVISPRHFAGELPGPRLGTEAQPSREARCQAANQRSGNRR
jgi:hypothetical protein